MKKQMLLTLLAVTMAVILAAATASAGDISFAPITGDEDCGISTDITYTHALDFGRAGTVPVNDVIFADVDASSAAEFPPKAGTSQTVGSGFTNYIDDNPGWKNSSCTGDIQEVIKDMLAGNNAAVVTLTGLTPGQVYKVRFYHRQWGNGPGNRTIQMGFVTDGTETDISAAEDTVDFKEDDATKLDPGFDTFDQVYALEYTYKLAPGVTSLRVHINSPDANYHLYMLTNEVVDGPEILFPKDGETVASGPITMAWNNMDPNTAFVPANDEVYVDVLFGTDPENLQTIDGSAYTNQTVSGVANMNAVDTTSLAPGTYYWQIISYVYGNPATLDYTQGAEPNSIASSIFMFSNDGPIESVDVGSKILTWDGEPVLLNSIIVDDGASELTYDWAISTPSGLTAVIEPGTDVENPTVTFTKFSYEESSLQNPSFEEPMVDGAIPGWTGGGGYVSVGGYDAAPDGENMIWIAQGTSATQVLDETVQAGVTYDLSADMGWDSRWGHTSSIYIVQLLAGTGEDAIVLAEDTASMDDPNAFYHAAITYTNDPVADADVIGLPLQIKLTCDADSDINAFFDNVVFTADSIFDPVMIPAEVTLTVQDNANPAVSGTVTIEVYSDKCLAARHGLGLDDPSDFDKDCDVDTDDLAIMAATWLSADRELDGPVATQGPMNSFNINFYAYGPVVGNDRNRLTLESDEAAGIDGWNTSGWENIEVPWGIGDPRAPQTLTSTMGDTATFIFNDVRNGGPHNGLRTTMLGDGNADLMDGHANGTDVAGESSKFDIELTDIPYELYDVIIYIGSNAAQHGDGTGKIIFNGVEQNFTLIKGFDGTFAEIVDETTPGNYIVYKGLTSSSLSTQVMGVGSDGFNHLGPTGFQIREVSDAGAPVVSTDGDWITWIGEPVELTGTVTEGPETTWDMTGLTYSWTAHPDDDPKLDVVISNPGDLNTTVTVNKVPYLQPFILNGGFEDTQGAHWITTTDDVWGHYDRDAGGVGYGRAYTNNPDYHFPEGMVPEGTMMLRASTRNADSRTDGINAGVARPDGVAVILDAKFDPSATYELSFAVGQPLTILPDNFSYSADTWNGYLVQLVVGGEAESIGANADKISGGTVIGEDASSVYVAPRTWETSTVTYTPNGEFDGLAGLPMQIRLLAVDNEDPESEHDTKVFYDDVKLLINGEAGIFVTEPGMRSVAMTLAVEAAGQSPAKAYVTIDAYNTPCDATKVSDPDMEFDLGDLNGDCITNLADFVKLAESWLGDYSIAGPVDKIEE